MPSSPGETSRSPAPFTGDLLNSSAMAPLIRQHDWAATPLGPMDQWPATLKGILEVGLNSRLPVCIYWGPEFVLLYNDAWSVIPGDKHPACLGQPARVAWSDIWSILDPMYNGILQTGVAAHEEDRLLPMVRFGYVEEAYFTYNVSPIFGPDGKPVGLFNTAVETTGNVIQQRRQRLLTRLAERLGQADEITQVCAQALALLAEAAHDVPFCLLYHAGTLLGACGTDASDRFVPARLTADDDPLHLFNGLQQPHQSPLGSQYARAFAPWPEVLDSTYATPWTAMPTALRCSASARAGGWTKATPASSTIWPPCSAMPWPLPASAPRSGGSRKRCRRKRANAPRSATACGP